MKERSKLYAIFKPIYEEIKTQFGVPIRIYRNVLSTFFNDYDIIHQTSCSRTPQ